jgi:hypothetical protein
MLINYARANIGASDNGTRPTDTRRSWIDNMPIVGPHFARKAHLLELALVLVAYLVYIGSRGLVFSDLHGKGLENAGRIVSAEKWVGVFWEPGWQSWVLEHIDGLALFFNWVYILTYWPIIMIAGLALYSANRPKYYYYRTVVVINLVVALLIFMVFPVASPFNLHPHFVNTIQELGPSIYGSQDMAAYYNTNAAMPSLHFSWTVILGVLFVRSLKGWFKPLGLLYPVVTFFAITITGNHFILDAVAGGLLAGVAFAVMEIGCRLGLFGKERNLETLKSLLRSGRAHCPIKWPKYWPRQSAVVRRYTLPPHKTAVQ